jgi:selenocysteine lyase/cysteine desulfurase
VEEARRLTPGVGHRVHLNNAGASLMPEPVLRAVNDHLRLESEVGGYEAADLRAEAIQGAYRSVAGLLGTHTPNVAFTENATASFVAALSSVPFRQGDRILTTRHDYVSNQIQYLALSRRMGVEVIRAPDGPEGGVDAPGMAEMVRRLRPRLVAMTHIPTNSGLVQDVATVGRECRALEVAFLVDACQSVGQMPLDVEAMGCDFLSATSRKFLRGPRGAGFLYVSDRVLALGWEPLFPDLRGAEWVAENVYQPAPDATRFETWEFAYALLLGTGAAAAYAASLGMERIRQRSWGLADQVRGRLSGLPGVRCLDRGAQLSAIATFHVEAWDPPRLMRALRERGINTSVLDRASAVLDFEDKGVEGALRVSPHYFNTEEEIEALAGAVAELLP